MSNFDDLLATSTQSLGSNPFADSFTSIISTSTDPWASYDQNKQLNAFENLSSTSFTTGDAKSESEEPHNPAPQSQNNDHNHDETELIYAENQTAYETSDEAPSQQVSNLVSASSQKRDDASGSSLEVNTAYMRQDEYNYDVRDLNSHSEFPSTEREALEASHSGNLGPASEDRNKLVVHTLNSLSIGDEDDEGWQESQRRTVGDQANFPDDIVAVVRDETHEQEKRLTLSQETTDDQRNAPEQPYIHITVDDPQKVGDTMRPYVLYNVHTRTNLPGFKKNSFSVLRRYSDFIWLYETISLNNPGVIVPPVPEKGSFGRFDSQFIQQRRLALEKCAQKVASHPILVKDDDFKFFLESDTFALDIKHRKNDVSSERNFMSTLSQSLTSVTTSKFSENDDWFEKEKRHVDNLEAQLKGLLKILENLSRQRAELALVIGEFSTVTLDLSDSGFDTELSHHLRTLSDVEKRAQGLVHGQSEDDVATLMSTVEEYSRSIGSVRMSFASRLRCYTSWQNAEAELRRIKQNHEKARIQGRITQDRIGYSLAQIADAERKVSGSRHEFERCSQVIKSEMNRFELDRINDFKRSMKSFLEGLIKRQSQLIANWENYQTELLKKS